MTTKSKENEPGAIAGTPRLEVPSVPPATQYVAPGSIYAITPTTEAVVRGLAERCAVEPVATGEEHEGSRLYAKGAVMAFTRGGIADSVMVRAFTEGRECGVPPETMLGSALRCIAVVAQTLGISEEQLLDFTRQAWAVASRAAPDSSRTVAGHTGGDVR